MVVIPLLLLALGSDSMRFIDNGQVRLGVDLAKGGAITYLSKSHGPNLVNDFDLGRQIQMSYYSGPVPFEPNDKKPQASWAGLGWNPIQSGDCYGHASKTLEFRSRGSALYLKCVPMQWPLDNEPGECTFESWITLRGNTVEVKNRIVNHRADTTQYPARTQELPAVYTNAPWYKLVTYTGEHPFSGDPTTVIPQHPWGPAGPWTSFQATERWAALVNDADDGLGVWAPDTTSISGGFAGVPGVGGSADSPTGYIAPNLDEILDPNVQYDNRYVLIVGKLDEIRTYAFKHALKTGLDSRFDRDRCHWTYRNAKDTGWPIHGQLDVRLEQGDPQLIGPPSFWRAVEAPFLVLRAAFHTSETRAEVFWSLTDKPGFDEMRSIEFKVIPDGTLHEYRVNLSLSPEYRGAITQIRIDPEPNGHPGDWVKVKSIRVSRD